jgi:hypothetical protein
LDRRLVKNVVIRVISTASVNPNLGLRHSGPIVCENRLCTIPVRLGEDREPNLTNTPLLGSHSPAEPVPLGEIFEIDAMSGTFRIVRLAGDASALVIDRVSGETGRPFWS